MSTPPHSNDTLALIPTIPSDGPKLQFDWLALEIGVAEYVAGPTGCTVFVFPTGATAAVDIRGGECGTLQTHHLDSGDHRIDALCFSGGSEYGFGAIAGVATELLAQRTYSTAPDQLVQVPGAVIYDFPLRTNAIYPDAPLGRAAVRAAHPNWFPLGRRGAGCSAAVGVGFGFDQREASGQGAAFRQVGAVKLAVFTVVNAIGAIVDRSNRVVRGHYDATTGTRTHASVDLERRLHRQQSTAADTGQHTTLTLCATNVALPPRSLRQLGKQVHTSMARAIQPFHTIYDGDVFFTVTTGDVADCPLSEIALGVLAAELAWDAVLSCMQPVR